MSRWLSKTLREVVSISKERLEPSDYADKEFFYLGLEDIESHRGGLLKNTLTRGRDILSTKNIFHAGQILYGKLRPYLNKVHLAQRDGICSTDICVLVCKRETVLPEYVTYYLRSPAVARRLTGLVGGAHLPRVNERDLLGLPIEIPPFSEQERIVWILNESDQLRRLRVEADSHTTALTPALFQEIFGDPATNPKSLRKEKLGNVLRVRSGNFLPANAMDQNGSRPVYGGNGISGYHSSYMFENPVIVIGRVGFYCGVVHYTEPKSWVTDNALYVAEKTEELEDAYLTSALRFANLHQYSGQAAQPLISAGRIYPVEILVPPLSLQREYVRRVTEVGALEMEQRVSRGRLEDLFQSLLYRTFQGEL